MPAEATGIIQGEANIPVTVPSSSILQVQIQGLDVTILRLHIFVQHAATLKITPKDSATGAVVVDSVRS